jgi:hypothetical protein
VIVISSCSQRDYKNLKEIDPNLVYIEKQYLDKKKLLDEVDKKLVVPKLSDLCSRIL